MRVCVYGFNWASYHWTVFSLYVNIYSHKNWTSLVHFVGKTIWLCENIQRQILFTHTNAFHTHYTYPSMPSTKQISHFILIEFQIKFDQIQITEIETTIIINTNARWVSVLFNLLSCYRIWCILFYFSLFCILSTFHWEKEFGVLNIKWKYFQFNSNFNCSIQLMQSNNKICVDRIVVNCGYWIVNEYECVYFQLMNLVGYGFYQYL